MAARKSSPTAATEAQVQRAGQLVMEARGLMVWRNNSRVFRVAGRGGCERLMRAGAGAGSADLMAVLPGGRFLAAEAKRPGEHPRQDQYAWLARVGLQGGVAFWFDDAGFVGAILDRILGPDGGSWSVGMDPATHAQWFEKH